MVSGSLQEHEKGQFPEGKSDWNKKLKEITQHLSQYQDRKVQYQILLDDLLLLINSLNPMKYLRTMFSEWRALHSGCAKVKARPSKTLKQKALVVISSDPTHKGSEGRTYLQYENC